MSTAKSIVRKFFPQVTEVEDATKSLEIEVTSHDDKTSRRKDHNGCALAVACKRQQHADGVIISIKSAYVVKGKKAIRYHLPESARREVVSFDRAAGFDPGLYKLSPPSPASRIGAERDARTGRKDKTLRVRHVTTNIRTHL